MLGSCISGVSMAVGKYEPLELTELADPAEVMGAWNSMAEPSAVCFITTVE